MKIAIGTTSGQKIRYLQEVLDELGISAKIEPIEISSDIPDQPINSKVAKQGSINRAKKAIKISNDANFSLGIEVGYHPNKNGDYRMFCWTTLIDRSGKQYSAQSYKLLLPSFHQKVIKEGRYLSDHVREYLELYSDPISQHVGVIIRDRKPFIQSAIKLVLLNYFVK